MIRGEIPSNFFMKGENTMIYVLLKIDGEQEMIVEEEVESIVATVNIVSLIEHVKRDRKARDVELIAYKNLESPNTYEEKIVRYVVKYQDVARDRVEYQDVEVLEGLTSLDRVSELISYIREIYEVEELYLLDWQVVEVFHQEDDAE